MRLLQSFFYDFKHVFTIDDKLIVVLAASIFMPFVINIIAIILIGFYVLIKSDFRNNLKSVKRSNVLLIFAVYLMITSLFAQNYLGALLSIGMMFIFVVVIYYRKYINKDLFEIILDVMIIMSVVSVLYAIGEQIYYANTVEGMGGFFDIQNKPQHRVHAFFYNANYYAMVILYVEAFCVYKFMTIKIMMKRLLYFLAGCANLFALYLTGGRIAWLCLAAAIIVMLVANKWYKTFIVACIGIGGGLGVLALKPGLIPRLASKGLELGRRTKIYDAAMLMAKDMWLFGRGPLTYYHAHADYLDEYLLTTGDKHLGKLGIESQHAHTIFLEPFISFGVIGSLIILFYLGSQFKRMIRLFTRNVDRGLGTLILGCIVITITFCIIDFPIFWVQTAMIFLLVLGASDIYKTEVE